MALSKILNPQKSPADLKTAAEHEAMLMADQLVANGSATWKADLDRELMQQVMEEWKAQKNVVRKQRILKP
jgi:hypothetical protein